MKHLFRTFKKSIYNPPFYQNVTHAPLGEAIRYYLKSTAVLSAIITIVLSIFLIPASIVVIRKYAPDFVKNYYPEKLVITLEKGEVSANVPMPYIVPIRVGMPSTGGMKNLLVIDTAHDFDKKAFDEYKTYALLTKTDLVTSSTNGQITIQTLKAAPSVTVSQQVLLSLIEKVRQSLWLILSLAVVAAFILFMLGYLLYLVALFLFALIPYVIAWVRKTPLSYGGAYKMSLYAIVPALAVKTLLNIFGLFFLPSYLALLVFMLVIAVNMRDVEPQNQ